MAFVRHVKVTLKRAKNINACTVRKSGTMVVATASYNGLLYTTNMVEEMGRNPAWENDGTNVFHFDFEDNDGHITVELFNRNNFSIGASKLLFSELGHLMPGQSEVKTLPVIEKQKKFGELVLAVEIMAQQAMGELGLLMVELRKGNIPKLTSNLPLFGSKTTKIGAKLIYKHTTHKSRVLENMGNKFVWHEDNTFTFIINSLKTDDKLKIEVYNTKDKVYNTKDKVGEYEILVSLFIEQEENRQKAPSELVSQHLCLPIRGSVGNIEVTACFTPKPVHQSSFAQTQQHPSAMPQLYPPPQHPSTSAPFCPPTHTGVRPSVVSPPQTVPQFHPLESFNRWSSAPSPESLYRSAPGYVHLNPSVSFKPNAPALRPQLYPPLGPHLYHIGPTHLHTSVSDQTSSYSPSAPAYSPEVVNHHSRGSSDTVLTYQHAHGAPGGREEAQYLYKAPEFDEEMMKYVGSFH